MAVLEKQRTESRPEAVAPAIESRRVGWVVWAIALLAIGAVVAVGLVVALSDEGTPEASVSEAVVAAPAAPAGETLYTGQELLMMRLANQGHIPRQAVDWELMELKRLVNLGLIPAQALESVAEPVASLYTAEERELMDLANRGLIPRESVDWETIELKRLINQGLIPRQAAP